MRQRPKVLLVGGMGFNVPEELKTAVDIVKHIEQGTRKLADLPAVEFILVISEFASHNIVETVKNEAKVPIVYLRKGWASMKEELIRRCILPPGPVAGQEAEEPAAAPEKAVNVNSCGLSEDEIWKTYRQKFIEAGKAALLPRELVSEADLLDILSMVGPSPSDCQLILWRLNQGGVVDSPKEGYWRSLMERKGFDFGDGTEPLKVQPKPKLKIAMSSDMRPLQISFNAQKAQEADDRARKLKGLPFGPYASKRAIEREMLKYEEWNPGGNAPASPWVLKRLIDRAVSLKVIDDTQKNLFIDHDPLMGLKKNPPAEQEEQTEPVPLPLPPERAAYQTVPVPTPPEVSPAVAKVYEDQQAAAAAAAKEELERISRRWPEVVAEVKKQKRMIGTILESCRFKWLDEVEKIAVVLVPAEFSMYRLQLESTENWGLVTKTARELLGGGVAVRFLMANGISR